MNIIACDDEKPALENLVIAIRGAVPDCELKAFRYPEEILAYAKENAVDVAFLDVSMPGMTGIELAKKLKAILPYLNIIFVTAYSHYAMDAVNLHASGYVLKPVSVEDVKREINNFLHPIKKETERRIYVQTFGNFEVFVDGRPLRFLLAKSKEMFAYLVDMAGVSVNRKELTAALFLDEPYSLKVQNYFTKIFKAMIETLSSVGLEDIVYKDYNAYAVKKDAIACDLYDYEAGDPTAISKYHGEYMLQYEWAEGKLL